ncbi:hemicentin-1-like [Pocillopora verrucosa]|uniref:hemicentin-1-like n=1 Tax=Pocillopora verrucosa TaxID=203993 RepID=UPI00333FE339
MQWGINIMMALLTKVFLLFLGTICAVVMAKGEGTFGIVQPFPENIFPLEYTTASVTCIAFDASGVREPEEILFFRRDDLNIYTKLKPSEKLSFSHRTEYLDGNPKLFNTMTITNVGIEDGSQYGNFESYECHAFAKNESTPKRHGFSISVITRDEIPKAVVVPHTNFVDKLTLSCSLTKRGNKYGTPLKRISWYKDGKLLVSLRNPDPEIEKVLIAPLKFEDVGVRDGGNYTCLLEVKLRHIKSYNVSDYIVIHIEPLFKDKDKKTVKAKPGVNATLECSARGYPLKVEWKLKNERDETVTSCINSSTDEHYNVTHNGPYDPYYLTITDMSKVHFGVYYCCLQTGCFNNITEDQCQRFDLVEAEGDFDQIAGTTPVVLHDVFLILAVSVVLLLL